MAEHDDPMHIDRARARRAERDAQPKRAIFPGLFARIEHGLIENDAVDMHAAGFPQSVIDSWKVS